MRKRGGASGKSRADRTTFRKSPLPATPTPTGKASSEPRDLRFTALTSSGRKTVTMLASPLHVPTVTTPSPQRTVGTIGDLKELFSSRSCAAKRILDHSHSEIVKELEASRVRLSKRLKLQMQTCQQLSEEVEKDYRKMSERITENMELMKASYTELITEAQASASRVCKVTILELAQSLEKAIDSLRSRYKVPLTSA
ncbi:unnamed protein product [Spirodela intermedia]|uniref:Uncharacterized protein n=1 Tax=Spirodela intermedia TaxID=51605 RepID=A0A7I8L1N1_SPIIN|nr:unnamed protein product [Spirodela intermedia]